MTVERVVALVPIRSFAQAKTRLALPQPQRARVAEALATRTLMVLRSAVTVDEVLVVSHDSYVHELAHRFGCRRVRETGAERDLNAAVQDATREARSMFPASATLAIVADLPALSAAVVDRAVQSFCGRGRPAFVADREGTGTTTVFRPPGDVRKTHFGSQSAHRHQSAGYELAPHVEWALSADLDLREDLDHPATPALLRHLARGRSAQHGLSSGNRGHTRAW
jgi:2-phospho-L-lactate guanylyltransferase